MKVKSMSFRAGDHEYPSTEACKFATKQGADLITICETFVMGRLSITVYYWDRE